MVKQLFTGAFTFPRGDEARGHFGIAGGTSPLGDSGSVRIDLRLADVPIYVDGGFVSVELREEWAAELSRVVGEVGVRLRHLRALHRLDKLAPSALYEEDPDAPQPGVRLVAQDYVARAIDGYVAPRAASPPRLVVEGLGAVLSYESIDARHVRVTFEGLDSIRVARGAPYEIPAEFGRRADELPAAVVEGSGWVEERCQHLSPPRSAKHHVFFFSEEAVEVLAQGFRVEYTEGASRIG